MRPGDVDWLYGDKKALSAGEGDVDEIECVEGVVVDGEDNQTPAGDEGEATQSDLIEEDQVGENSETESLLEEFTPTRLAELRTALVNGNVSFYIQ